MSVAQTVFLDRARLPTREAWMRALEQHGFGVELDAGFEPSTDEGYIPCVYRGGEAGFEYLVGAATDYLAEQDLPALRDELGARDLAVSFLTHGRMADLQTATLAAAALAALSDGLLWSDEAGEMVDAPLAYAREIDAA